MTENLHRDDAVVTEETCGICLEDSTDPLNLPCGHSFCDGCLNEWRSRYGVDEEMRRKCPICRASIPPSKEMVAALHSCLSAKQRLEDKHDTSSERYHDVCNSLAQYEENVGADWDRVTVLEDNKKPPVAMPDYLFTAIGKGDIKSVLRWIDADRTEDRVNAVSSTEKMGISVLSIASIAVNLTLMSLLLQLGADVDFRANHGGSTLISLAFDSVLARGNACDMVKLFLSWGASFFPGEGFSREYCASRALEIGEYGLANLFKSELGGRRCEIVNLTSRPEINGQTCVVDEYLPTSNQYKVTLESKDKEVLLIGPDNLKRRDRTPQDCGYYIEYKNGRTIRHDFESSEDCQAFVAALNKGETQPVVTEEAEARAEQAAAELLAELGLDDSPNESSSGGRVKKSKKKKGGKKKKK